MKRTASIKRFPLLVCAFFLAGLAFLCPGRAAAQGTADYGLPQGFTFWNEISSGLVEALGRSYNKDRLDYINRQNYNAEFAGIKEKVGIRFDSEKLGVLLEPEFSLVDAGQHWSVYYDDWDSAFHAINQDDLSFTWTGMEWYVRFTPFDVAEVNLHRSVRTAGGYLAVIDRWLDESELQGAGVGVILSPVRGLRLASALPMGFQVAGIPNTLNGEIEDTWWPAASPLHAREGYGSNSGSYTFVLNAGADYELFGLATLGVTVHDMLNAATRGAGVYAAAQLAFMQVRAGYTYNGEATRVSLLDFDGTGLERVYVGGRHKASLSATVELGGWRLCADALWNVRKKQSIYDLYTGLRADYGIIPGTLELALSAALVLDFGNDREKGVGFARTREKGRHELPMYTPGTYWFHPKKGSGDRSERLRQAEMAAPMLELWPGMTYVTGRNTFTAGAKLQYWIDGEASWAASFPVSWRVAF